MSTETKPKKSGRTPEQQAARDARKAAKLAAAATVAANTSAPEAAGESSTQAAAPTADAGDTTEAAAKKEKKRRRENDEENNDPSLMEIDVKAPEPLSKAEERAARKRRKRGLPDLPAKQSKPAKRPKADSDEDSDGLSDGAEEDDEAKAKKAQAKAKAKAEEASTKRQKQNSIWIGNLSFRTTPESLKAYIEAGLVKAGADATGAVTRVNMPKTAGGQKFANNKGFAYVDFATPELQQIGVGLSETFFEGRKLLMKLGNDYAADPNARTPKPDRPKADPMAAGILKRQQHPEGPTLFMGNLPFDATEEAIRDLIEENAVAPAPAPAPAKADAEEGEDAEDKPEVEEDGEGEAKQAEQAEPENTRGGKKSGLRKVRLGAFEDTGRCKGFAFLDFYQPADATRTLVNRKNHFFGGRKLNLQYASEDATRRSGANRNKDPTMKTERKPRNHYSLPGISNPGGEERNGAVTRGYEAQDTAAQGESREYVPPAQKKDQRGKRWEATGRPRPGAALAMAKREKVGIVKGEGEKIVFD